MPGIEDFLEDARAEALWVMRDTAALRAQGAGATRAENDERLRTARDFRRSLNAGVVAAGEGIVAVLDATGGTPRYVAQALAGGGEAERVGAEPHSGLVRMRENFRAVADLCSSLPPGQHQQVRDHVLASHAAAVRGVAAAQVAVGEEETGSMAEVAGRLTRLADLADSLRGSRGFPELSERVAMTGVPSCGDFHAALATWARGRCSRGEGAGVAGADRGAVEGARARLVGDGPGVVGPGPGRGWAA